MTAWTVAEGVVQPLRQLLEGRGPVVTAAEEHLHYDRAARAWLTHAELYVARSLGQTDREPELAGCV